METTLTETIQKKKDEIFASLPKEVFQINALRAFATLGVTIFFYIFGLYGLANMPWFFLPIGWVFMGTVFSGLSAVGYDCGRGTFSRSGILNAIIGNLVSIPMLIPFENWKLHTLHGEWEKLSNLSRTPFWWLSSIWQWLRTNFDLRSVFQPGHRRKIIFSMCCTYIFGAIFFPTMLYNAGIWGLCKYWFFPWCVYHFWMSSFISTSYKRSLEGELNSTLIVHCRYPYWVEYLTNNMNYIAMANNISGYEAIPSIPNYNLKQSFESLKHDLGKYYQEVCFGWEVLYSMSFLNLLQIINWPTALFIFLTPVISIYGILHVNLQFSTGVLMIFTYYFFGMGITMGYHRLFAHRSYDCVRGIQFLLLFMGTGAFEGSALWWCRDHRAHHRFSDTEKDPYGVNKGFWWAHVGWLLVKRDESKIGKTSMKDLERDPMLVFQDKYYVPLAFLVGIVLPTVVAGLFWGDWMGGFFYASVTRVVLVMQATFCINSLAHFYGQATFDDTRSPRDSYLVSLVTFGEGFHNFHHEFPYDYRNGVYYHAYDPSKWLIYLLSFFGLASNLKRFPANEIQKGVLQMQQKNLNKKKSILQWGSEVESLPVYTWEQIKARSKEGSSLLVIDNIVHDVAQFVERHPGGSKMITTQLGTDASLNFNGVVYNHSNAARNLLSMMRVGRVEEKMKLN